MRNQFSKRLAVFEAVWTDQHQIPAKNSTLDHWVNILKFHHQRILQKCLEDPEITSQKANRLGMMMPWWILRPWQWICLSLRRSKVWKGQKVISNLKVQNQAWSGYVWHRKTHQSKIVIFAKIFRVWSLILTSIWLYVDWNWIMVYHNDKSRCVFLEMSLFVSFFVLNA